jgi:hypothetical protein
MDQHRWQRIERLYHSALERDAKQGNSYLAQECPGDEALRRELESVLEQPLDGARRGESEALPGRDRRLLLRRRHTARTRLEPLARQAWRAWAAYERTTPASGGTHPTEPLTFSLKRVCCSAPNSA